MKKTLLLISVLAISAGTAFASGTHSDGHDDMMNVGKPGTASKVDRTIEVTMKETDDGDMIFEPNNLQIKKGETIRFVILNAGELEHEFVLDGHEEIMKHKALMGRMPEMEHDDPNAVRLIEGTQGEVIWTFANSGAFEFACLIPGHYEAGMKGSIAVAAR
ncbi:MAG: cupredoxin family protein [Rhizobiaceae bacterium]|nr:cupredoxin family protein [Rhizobiaceae bacterium]